MFKKSFEDPSKGHSIHVDPPPTIAGFTWSVTSSPPINHSHFPLVLDSVLAWAKEAATRRA